MSDLVNAGVVKQMAEHSFIVQGPDGELNFDYVKEWKVYQKVLDP